MGTIPVRHAKIAAEARIEAMETERWIRCADAMDVMNGKSHYPGLDESTEHLVATQTLGIIANGGTFSEGPSVLRAKLRNENII